MSEHEEITIEFETDQPDEANNGHKLKYKSRSDSLSWGIGLIGVGVLFLLDNLGLASVATHNWWAIFILAPGINKLVDGVQAFKNSGRFNYRVRQHWLWGFTLITIALIFLFNLDFSLFFPIFLILFGISMLSGRGRS